MLLLTLLDAAAEAIPHAAAATEPANVYTAWVAWAAAIGAVAVALGPVFRAKAAEREEQARAAAPPAPATACDVDEKKLAEFTLQVFRAYYGDDIRRFWKHHLELHTATFGDKLLGSDGIVEMVRDNAEVQAAIGKLVTELVEDLHAKKRDADRALVEAAEVIRSGGTNPGTPRR